MEVYSIVYSIDLTLILLLPHVVLTHMTTRNSEFMDSSIMNLLHTNTPICDSKTSTQRFKSSAEMSSDGSNFYNIRSAICTLLGGGCVLWFAIGYGFQKWLWWLLVDRRERERQIWTWQTQFWVFRSKPNFGSLEANLVLRLFMLLRLPTVHSFGLLEKPSYLEGVCYGVPMITLPLAK